MADANSTPTRICTCCKTEFPVTLEYFPPHKMGKFGLHSNCRPCKKLVDAERRARPDQKSRQQAWRDANKDKVKSANQAYRAAGYKSTDHVKAWRALNIEHAREYDRLKQRRLRHLDPERHRAKVREYYYRNRQDVLRRANIRSSRMYREDKWFNLRAKIAVRLRQILASSGGKASRKTEQLLGYSRGELITHIERQFTKGMSWQKVFSGEIHIDHIIPVSHLRPTSTDSDAFRHCWALANLRPMWASENKRKRDRLTSLL